MAINSFKLTDTGVTPEKIDQAAAYNFTNTNSTFAGVGGEGIDETKAYNFSNSSGTFAGQVSGTITGITQPTALNFTNTSSTFEGTVKKILYGKWADKSALPAVGDMYFATDAGYLCICAFAGTWSWVQLSP